MLKTILATIIYLISLFSGQPVVHKNKVLAQVNYSLSNRYDNTYVNDVFVDNILLTLAYMGGKIKPGQNVSWDSVKKSGSNTLLLKPGETFAFHDNTLPKYKKTTVATTNAHFTSNEGFKSDGWLVG